MNMMLNLQGELRSILDVSGDILLVRIIVVMVIGMRPSLDIPILSSASLVTSVARSVISFINSISYAI
jgi:hypothetical protein